MKKVSLYIFLTILLGICIVSLIYKENKKIKINDIIQKNLVVEEKEIPKDININMCVVGDIMCHNTQYFDAYKNGVYDFSYVFSDIQEKLQGADITVGNLETTFAGMEKEYSSFPRFNTPEALATDLKEAGFDVLSTANNHSLDKGFFGIESTIKYLDEAEIAHTGTYINEKAQNEIIIINVKGIKIAFLSFTYGTNGLPVPKDKEYCIDLIDKDFIIKKLNLAKNKKPDLICVFMHWGEEYQNIPNEEQIELSDLLFKNGTDIILGSHPHVLQKMEKRIINLEDGSTKDGFIIYSLGNFISGQVKEDTRSSILLNLYITKDGKTGKLSIDGAKYTPIYMYKTAKEKSNRYKVLDIKKAMESYDAGNREITVKEYDLLQKEYSKIINTLGEEL